MSTKDNRRQPMSERLFNTPMNGGPSPKHIWAMIKELCIRDNMLIPELNIRDQQVLATWLSGNFSKEDIDWAHRDRVAYYERMNQQKTMRTPPPTISRTPPPTEDLKDFPDLDLSKDNQDQEQEQQPSPRKRERKPRQPSDDNEKYVLRSDYEDDQLTLVDEFEAYDKKIKGQQKAVESAIAKSDAAMNALTDGLTTIDKRLIQLEAHAPTILKVEYPNFQPVEVGLVHNKFPLLLKASNARMNDGTRLNIWAYGPAGTGKTYAAQSLAKAQFNTEYCSTVWTAELQEEFKNRFNQEWKGHDYNGSLATQFQVFGYMDASGRYVSTAFRRIWEYGGVYLFDEIDGSMPDALLALQGALSSEYASFPDGLVKRHQDCIIIAGANTTGMGGGIEYIGAMKQNAAFLNRWIYLHWPHDNALEDALCDDKKWVRRVRQVRTNLEREQIRSHLVTMRQSMQGNALLKAGIDWEDVERMTLRGCLTDAQWERVCR